MPSIDVHATDFSRTSPPRRTLVVATEESSPSYITHAMNQFRMAGWMVVGLNTHAVIGAGLYGADIGLYDEVWDAEEDSAIRKARKGFPCRYMYTTSVHNALDLHGGKKVVVFMPDFDAHMWRNADESTVSMVVRSALGDAGISRDSSGGYGSATRELIYDILTSVKVDAVIAVSGSPTTDPSKFDMDYTMFDAAVFPDNATALRDPYLQYLSEQLRGEVTNHEAGDTAKLVMHHISRDEDDPVKFLGCGGTFSMGGEPHHLWTKVWVPLRMLSMGVSFRHLLERAMRESPSATTVEAGVTFVESVKDTVTALVEDHDATRVLLRIEAGVDRIPRDRSVDRVRRANLH